MKIRVLGCHGGSLPGFSPVSLLIDEKISLDAGTLTSVLSFQEQLKISSVLLTHPHLDHFHELAFLIDNRKVENVLSKTVTVYSTQNILQYIHSHIFNDIIWPDYTKKPAPALLELYPIEEGCSFSIEDYQIEAVRVEHAIEAVGFIVRGQKGTCVFSGDTKATEKLWRRAQTYSDLKAVFLELSYSERKSEWTKTAKHHSVSTFVEELKKIPEGVDVYAYHLKPQFYEEIKKELLAYRFKNVQIIQKGEVLII
ncbi:MAG: 3',5'-cyclic-nucleotide phosphodiesterase [Deltaproteobacteria bacterium]|nr:3',5'-cyclic-nucleotide phosphodiesterase [Deltaproteobacteria bacterium]